MAQASSKDRLITATFHNHKDSERAYKAVTNRKGYGEDDVSVLMSEDTRDRHFADGDRVETEMGNKATEGAGVGAATGGTLGGIAGAIAALGSAVAIPGIGLVIAGPLAGALTGAGAGGAAGTLVGGLIGAGIPEERAKRYKSDIKEGGIVLGVRPHSDEDAQYFRKEWKKLNGERIHVGEGDTTTTSSRTTDGYADHKDDFRTHFRDKYGSDAKYATYEPAYRYGFESARDDRFRERSYTDAEKDLRSGYTERHPNSKWDKMKSAVRYGYERARRKKSRAH